MKVMFLIVLVALLACSDGSTVRVGKTLFVTAAGYNGNLGGVSGADAKCMADANKPSDGKTYKAMLTDGSTRIACTSANCTTSGNAEHLGWVLHPALLTADPMGL